MVATNNELTKWIPAMTHNNTLMGISPVSIASDSELLSRFFFNHKVLGYSNEMILELANIDTYIDLFHFKDLYSMASFPLDRRKESTKILDHFEKDLKELISIEKKAEMDFEEKFRYDYILINKNSLDHEFKQNDQLNLVFENSRFLLYKKFK